MTNNPYYDSRYEKMGASDLCDKTADLFAFYRHRLPLYSAALYALKAAFLAALTLVGFYKVLPAVGGLSYNAIISGGAELIGLVAVLALSAAFMTIMGKAWHVLTVQAALEGRRISAAAWLRLAPKTALFTAVYALIIGGAAAVLFIPLALSFRQTLFAAALSLVLGGNMPSGLTAFAVLSALAALVVACVGMALSLALPVCVFEGRVFTALASSVRLMKRSLSSLPLRALWGAAYACALWALMAALGLVIKAPVVRVNQYLYTAVFAVIKFGLARLILSPLHPIPAVMGAFYYTRARAALDEKFAEKTAKKPTPFAKTAKRRGEPSKNGSFRPSGIGAVTASLLTDLSASSTFVACALFYARIVSENGMSLPAYVPVLSAAGVFAAYYAIALSIFKTTLGRALLRVKVVWKGGKRLVIVMTKNVGSKPSSRSR